MNIAVLGQGFVGSYVFNYLSANNDGAVHLLTQSANEYHKPGKLSSYIKDFNIEAVVNTCGFTGYPNVDNCETNKAACTLYNVTIPLIIEEECKKANAKLIHVSSGCIYTGYEKEYDETDIPNFGIHSEVSSFYSKTKHLSEMFLDTTFTNILRIRMPITGNGDHKNLLIKLLKYDNLIDYRNSKTDIYTLCELVKVICYKFKPGIYNAVHHNALRTAEVVGIMISHNLTNPNWKFVPYEDIPIVANRSNCVLSNEKIKRDFNFDFKSESHFIARNCSLIAKENKWQEKE